MRRTRRSSPGERTLRSGHAGPRRRAGTAAARATGQQRLTVEPSFHSGGDADAGTRRRRWMSVNIRPSPGTYPGHHCPHRHVRAAGSGSGARGARRGGGGEVRCPVFATLAPTTGRSPGSPGEPGVAADTILMLQQIDRLVGLICAKVSYRVSETYNSGQSIGEHRQFTVSFAATRTADPSPTMANLPRPSFIAPPVGSYDVKWLRDLCRG